MGPTSTPAAIAVLGLRIAAGGLIVPHAAARAWNDLGRIGLDDFLRRLESSTALAPTWPLSTIAMLQVAAAIAVMVGWYTRAAAAIGIVALVAGAVAHAATSTMIGSSRELAAVALPAAGLLAIALAGPGPMSLDVALRSAASDAQP